jgi:diguanylate cyclase (GGDEF)-like protein
MVEGPPGRQSFESVGDRSGVGRAAPRDDERGLRRRSYLEALPGAAAIVECEAGHIVSFDRNRAFDEIGGEIGGDLDGRPVAALPSRGLVGAIRDFIIDGGAISEFGWTDGAEPDARYFSVRLARLHNEVPGQHRCLLTVVERTSEVATARSLRSEMMRDALTGLPNRVAFTEAVEAAMGTRFAVIIVDLERFSQLNDSLGTLVGDELIVTTARRLVAGTRPGDVLARLGGDEFGVLLSVAGEEADDALHAARRIVDTLSAPFRLSDLQIRVGVAVGVALPGDGGSVGDDVVRNAQFALKQAKKSGRIELYQPNEAVAARRRFSLETDLRRAIENGDLTLAYQPLIDLASGRVAGFEALARWQHPALGEIPPTEFIPVAEESGLIVPLGRWALSSAVETLAHWDRAGGSRLPCDITVNMSAIQLARDDVAAAVADVLERNRIDGRRLTIELTESAIVKEPERVSRVLSALKALRVRIAMDDFGTGYSSLSSLQKLPIDMLKIDRSFVAAMLDDRDSVAIVRAVLSLANALDMATIGEGVETKALADTLAALGCSYGQGFHYAPPLGRDEALAYFLSRNA